MEFLVVQDTRIDYGRIYLQTILEEEEPSTPPVVDEKPAIRSPKVRTLLSLLHLNFYLFTTSWFSAICLGLPSVSPTQAVFFEDPCSTYHYHKLNICALTATKKRIRPILWISFSSVLYHQSPYRIYLPALVLKLGMALALLRWVLCFLCWVF